MIVKYCRLDCIEIFLQETAARDGLMKMKTVYEANPALGDPMSIQGQLTENGHRLDKLRSDFSRYQVLISNSKILCRVSRMVRNFGKGQNSNSS